MDAVLKNASKQFNVALQTPEEAVGSMLKIIDGLKPADNGLALSADGQW